MKRSGSLVVNASKQREGKSPAHEPHKLLDWDQLLPWQKDNEYILSSYRKASYSWQGSLESINRVHNETVNIWSHGLGAIFYGYFLFQPAIKSPEPYDLVALGIYYASVVVCFVFSSTFHTFLNHSPGVWRVCSQLDHLGIVLVIWGSSVASTYFGFYCEGGPRRAYWALATVSATASAWATFQPAFRTPTGRSVRVAIYAVLGLSAFVPAVHGVLGNGWSVQNERQALVYFIGLGCFNGLGTAIYGARVPERWFPRAFDVCGASHQIMHVLVMCGAYSHSVGLRKALEFWRENNDVRGYACS